MNFKKILFISFLIIPQLCLSMIPQEKSNILTFCNYVRDGEQYIKPHAIKAICAQITGLGNQLAPSDSQIFCQQTNFLSATSPDRILYIRIDIKKNKIACFHAQTKVPLNNLSALLQNQLQEYCSLLKSPYNIQQCTITQNSKALILIFNDFTCIGLWCDHDCNGNIRVNTNPNLQSCSRPHYGISYNESAHVKKCIPSPYGLFAAYQDVHDNWDIVQLLSYADEQPEKIAEHTKISDIIFSPLDRAYLCREKETNTYSLHSAHNEHARSRQIGTLPSCIRCFFTPDGKNLITTHHTGEAKLWDAKDCTPVAHLLHVGRILDKIAKEYPFDTGDINAADGIITTHLYTGEVRTWSTNVLLSMLNNSQKE